MIIEEIARSLAKKGIMVRSTLTSVGWVADIKFYEHDRTWTYLFPKETSIDYVHPKHFKTLLELYQAVDNYMLVKTPTDIINDESITKYYRESFICTHLEDDRLQLNDSCTNTN